METLKIKIPKGFEVDDFNKTTGEIKFKPTPKSAIERIKNFDDILAENNLTQEKFDTQITGLPSDEKGYRKVKLIVAAYNDGKLPDFTDGTYKYWPYFKMGSPSGVGFSCHGYDDWYSHSSVGARLVFCGKNAKVNMLDAVEKFLPEYKQFYTLKS